MFEISLVLCGEWVPVSNGLCREMCVQGPFSWVVLWNQETDLFKARFNYSCLPETYRDC
jgi:hypothetical protein